MFMSTAVAVTTGAVIGHHLEGQPEGLCCLIGLEVEIGQIHIGRSQKAGVPCCSGIKHINPAENLDAVNKPCYMLYLVWPLHE